nr:EOG090X0508 [Megafenestra aurita]
MPPKKHKKRKSKPKKNWDEPEEIKRAPHSIVVFRGNVGKYIEELMRDFRRVMEPNTASSLKATEKNSIKDFVSIAGPLHVTHLVVFSRSELSPFLRLCRLPHGPTLTFKILEYSLSKDVVSTQKRQNTYDRQYLTHPLVVLNNFVGEELKLKLMTSMLQNMFPSIDVTKVKLNTIRRCVLLHYYPEDGSVEFRHYSIKAVPVGVSKAVKKLVSSKVPNLGKLNDISEFIEKSGNLSDSEVEDDPVSKVTLPQNLAGRGAKEGAKSALRMIELGPRMRLELIKIEEGLIEGEVLYHQFIQKTEEEKKVIRLRRETRRKNNEKVRKIQEAERKQKEEVKERHREKSMEGMKRKEDLSKFAVNEENEADEEDDDAEYYRSEIGQEPEKDLFTARTKSSKSSLSGPAAKRVKREKKKMMDKSNKTSNGKSTFKGKQRDDGDFREKGFKSRKSSRPGGEDQEENIKPVIGRFECNNSRKAADKRSTGFRKLQGLLTEVILSIERKSENEKSLGSTP